MPSSSHHASPSRRGFLKTSALAGMSLGAFHLSASAVAASRSPNERLRLAAVGVTGRAGENVRGCASEEIVAAADIDSDLLAKGVENLGDTRRYADWRDMLEKEADRIDAVLVGTPDHSHAPAAARALRLGKHVYCEKPLTHTVKEARVLATLAKEKSLVTQMGTQIHAGDNYRRVVELVRAGAIGQVSEVHVWAGAVYTGGSYTTDVPCPPNVNWDLWLGPATERPYSAGCHPFNWRRFWDYGNGTLGDFGCHYMDLAHWALDLRDPTTIEARGPEVDPVSTPAWCEVDYHYPARGDRAAVKLHWYDSGRRPALLAELKDRNGNAFDWGGGQLFVGEKGMLISDYGRHVLLPEDRFTDYQRPEPTIPSSIGHHQEWLEAIRTGGETTCNFDYSGALTEAVLLGTVAYRSGVAIEWDAANLKVTNSEAAQQWVHKEYRRGWDL
ncbi:MAG: Gfo/Idh/MocA family oxidoreductase [Pirellulaceae bacterium]|nr:Gfo/Idh/MocA family oxidoreductase [Planctomycetales bacterium]